MQQLLVKSPMIKRVGESLRLVGMTEYRASSPNKLSGGQKQRVAIAGVIAMEPKCIVLDLSLIHIYCIQYMQNRGF